MDVNVRSVAISILVLAAVVIGGATAHAAPQHVVDEEEAVGAGDWHAVTIKLDVPRPVQVVAQGVRHVDKGFMVYVMSPDDFAHFRLRESFHHVGALAGLKVRSMTQTATLAAGSWVVVVQNSENILRTMIVHLRVTIDPETAGAAR